MSESSSYSTSIGPIPTAAVLIIGNEILSGRTQDINLHAIATRLTKIGIPLHEARVVADIEEEIVEAINALRHRYTYVFTTGGIGPTHDDITADSIAKAFGVEVELHAEAKRRLEQYAVSTGRQLNPSSLRMARIPKGATLIDNPVSVAPGFHIGNVYVMAGVPNIMQSMIDGIVATLKHGPAIHSRTVSGYVGESTVAEELGKIAQTYPQLDIGSYPWVRNNRHGTALVAKGTDIDAINAADSKIYALMLKHDPESVRE